MPAAIPIIASVGGSVVSGMMANKGANDAAGASQQATEASIAEQARQYDTTRADFAPFRTVGVSALDSLARLYGLRSMGPNAPTAGTRVAPAYSSTGGGSNEFLDPLTGKINPLKPPGLPDLSRLFGGSSNGNASRGAIASAIAQASAAAPAPGEATVAADYEQAGPDMSVFTESPDYQFNLAEGQKAIDRSLVARGRGLSGAGVREGVRYASGMASTEFGNFYNRLANLAGIGQSATNSTAAAGASAANNNSQALINNGNARASAYMTGAAGTNNAIQGGISNLLTHYYSKPADVTSSGWSGPR